MGLVGMSGRDLLNCLVDNGYSIRTDGRMLYVRGRAPLDQEIKDSITRHKQDLIAVLLSLQTAGEQAAEEAARIVAAAAQERRPYATS
jgi:hypothetical protein